MGVAKGNKEASGKKAAPSSYFRRTDVMMMVALKSSEDHIK
jgi:hypothetical protein